MRTPMAADRLADVLSPVIPAVGQLLHATPGALSLAQGMVDWNPPRAVSDSIQRLLGAVAEGTPAALHRYGAGFGEPEVLETVQAELRQRRGLDLEDSFLLLTAGSNMAFHAIAQVILAPGDEVILPLPWYFNHAMAVQLAGGVPLGVDAGPIPDPDRLAAAITPRCRAIVTISPNNPGGVVMPPSILRAINALCARHGLFHISDEAYADFVHGTVPHHSPGSGPGSGRHTISLYSLSKAYGMAGWRVGYAAVPIQLASGMAKVQDTLLICPPRLQQEAARVALQAGTAWLAPHMAVLRQRRRQLIDAVDAAARRGLAVTLSPTPDGAFYGLLRFPSRLAGEDLLEQLVRQHGVAALPGESFGFPSPARCGVGILRLSYGMLPADRLDEALARLLRGLEQLALTG